MPYALAFAAGAMIFVVAKEVIPETQQDKNTDMATLGFVDGFIDMMKNYCIGLMATTIVTATISTGFFLFKKEFFH